MDVPTQLRPDHEVLDALGPDTVSAGQLADRLRMSVREAVVTLCSLRDRGLVVRQVIDEGGLAEWRTA